MPNERSDEGSARLAWPPLAEDLRRLYLDQKLSASKIAAVYGLKYASAKTAESTILYHLKRNGITRRDPAAHVRKVTEAMVDEWVVRYQKGESLKKIACDAVDPVTVFNHLRRRGLKLRDRVEAQTAAVSKFEKLAFSGDRHELAYLIGMAIGDFASARHGRAVRVKTSTTHPAMTRLFRSLFEKHGPIYEYPRESPLTGFEWSLDCDLDSSYSFLIDIRKVADEVMIDDDLFFDFLAGFFDSDGSLYFHKKKMHGAFEFSLINMDETLLRKISARMSEFGFTPHLSMSKQSEDRGVLNGADHIWRLALWKYDEVVALLKRLPIRHPEKKAKAEIALRLGFRPDPEARNSLIEEWEALKASIKADCLRYVESAKEAMEQKSKPNHSSV
jgi:hypothetical protein